ncbi:MAG: hypothetical protein HQM03_15115 [Magnetococcales bacterium]|nr:hypothetical protein [Magnetococcales bacterium]
MTALDEFRQVAREIKLELDKANQAFKTFQQKDLIAKLKNREAQPHIHVSGNSIRDGLENAFLNEGLIIFPGLSESGSDGYIRVYRNGTVISAILNAMRFPGKGSDEELSGLLAQLKTRRERSKGSV